jgi:uncharacterized protein
MNELASTLFATGQPSILIDSRFTNIQIESDCACADDGILSSGSMPFLCAPGQDALLESDCACSDLSLQNTTVPLGLDWARRPLQISAQVYHGRLSDIASFVFLPEHGRLAVLNSSARDIYRTFTHPTTPERAAALLAIDPGIFQSQVKAMSALGLLEVPGETHLAPLTHQTLTAWLHLTDACNLRCDYCFLPHSGPSMRLDTGLMAIDAAFRSADLHGFSQVKLKYSGGEPALRLPLLFALHDHAIRRAQETGLKLTGVVLTNGVLWSETLLKGLQERGLRLAVSLDGLGFYQDVQRKTASGKGSFKRVRQTLSLAQDMGLTVSITVTVSALNLPGLPELVRFLLREHLPFTLNFYRENACSMDQTQLSAPVDDMITGLKSAFRVIEEQPPNYSLLGVLADRARLDIKHTQACGVNQSYLVFTPSGEVARCHMLQSETVSSVRAKDPLGDLIACPSGLRIPALEEKTICQDCTWRYACAGGCPLAAQSSGDKFAPSPNCAIYKAILPEILRLEGIRLLKHAQIPYPQFSQEGNLCQ